MHNLVGRHLADVYGKGLRAAKKIPHLGEQEEKPPATTQQHASIPPADGVVYIRIVHTA
jgi:hypothetical protein